jgi:hypothetical protein
VQPIAVEHQLDQVGVSCVPGPARIVGRARRTAGTSPCRWKDRRLHTTVRISWGNSDPTACRLTRVAALILAAIGAMMIRWRFPITISGLPFLPPGGRGPTPSNCSAVPRVAYPFQLSN